MQPRGRIRRQPRSLGRHDQFSPQESNRPRAGSGAGRAVDRPVFFDDKLPPVNRPAPQSRQILQQAVALAQSRRSAEAEQLCRNVIRAEPDNAEALHLLGSLRLNRGDAAAAVQLIEAAIRLRPAAALYHHNLGKALDMQGQADAAVAAHRRAVAARADNADFWEALAIAERDNKEMARAAESFRRALALVPGRVATLTRLGDLLQVTEDLPGAIACYRDAIARDGSYAPAHNNLGSALQLQGDFAGATAAHERALALAPKETKYWINLGVARFTLGETGAAQEAFEACLKLAPFDRRAIAYRTAALAELDQFAATAALAELRRFLTPLMLDTPPGWESMDALNRQLAKDLMAHRSLRWEPVGTATTGGADILLLLQHPTPAITAFAQTLRAAIDRHLADLPVEPGHPFLDRRITDYALDIWGTVLKAQGHQSPHIHPTGWMSGVYYVQMPESLGSGGHNADHSGWIEFGRPPDSFRLSREPAVELVRPEPGLALFFPSYLYHRTIPFEGPTPRISIAFDVRLPLVRAAMGRDASHAGA
jgi:uncharacterized protein (TIGR02466 family)